MRAPFTSSQIKLARRICRTRRPEKGLLDNSVWDPKPLTRKDFEDFFEMITNAPAIPDPTPPWWEQAIAWADEGMLWIRGYGYMSESMWRDCLKTEREET